MSARLSDILTKAVLMAAAFAAATLVLRDGFALGLKVPLDPNEGWNAYHTLAAIFGNALYPHDGMTNNYPPLSFFVVGMLGRSLGDFVVAGRMVSLVSFVAIAMALAALVRQMEGVVMGGILAALFFASVLLFTTDYVAMNDPQLMGHALQVEALLLLAREKPQTVFAALLAAAGLFIKQNLFILPLAALIWLTLHDRRQAVRFALYGIGFGVLGLIVSWAGLGVNVLSEMAAPRLWTILNVQTGFGRYLSWAALPILLTAALAWTFRRDRWMQLASLYAGVALVAGVLLSSGDGVDANIFFDLDIAMALTAGLALGKLPDPWRGPLALGLAAPLALFLARNFHDGNFAYSEGFQRQAGPDIAFLTLARGPTLCESLSLCYWAGKPATLDVFNTAEAFKTGARSDEGLAAQIRQRKFAAIQMDSLTDFALGARVRGALETAYRVDHIDDNGVFLVPR